MALKAICSFRGRHGNAQGSLSTCSRRLEGGNSELQQEEVGIPALSFALNGPLLNGSEWRSKPSAASEDVMEMRKGAYPPAAGAWKEETASCSKKKKVGIPALI